MAALRLQNSQSTSRRGNFETPPPVVPAPTPKSTPCGKSKAAPAVVSQPSSSSAPPPTEGARLQRLRRLCEVKPSGRCHVPEEVHLRWKRGTNNEREAMVEELEKAGWSKDLGWDTWDLWVDCHSEQLGRIDFMDFNQHMFSPLDYMVYLFIVLSPAPQDLFISRITRTLQRTNRLSRKKKRGWFTKEQMSKVLQWSGFLG